MTDAPLTLSDILTLLALAGSVGGLWWRISSMLDAHRIASNEGRRRLYEHIDGRLDKLEATFQRKDMHERDMKTALDGIDENHRLIVSLAGRVCPYPREREE